jgi:two-component system, CitB family, sensor kinase
VAGQRRAVEFATSEIASTQQLTDQLTGSVSEPALAALLLGKAARAHQRGIDFTVTPETGVAHTFLSSRELITTVGNLVDNAIDAAADAPPPRRIGVTVQGAADSILVRVSDSGPGIDPERLSEALTWGWSTKQPRDDDATQGRGLGLALVEQIVRRYGGTIHAERDDDTTVSVWLPAPVGHADAGAPHTQATVSPTPPIPGSQP